MRTYEDLQEIINTIVSEWGEKGKRVIETAFEEHNKITMNNFMENCIACGGNWGGMLLSGMKKLYPKTYEAIPEDMGHSAFFVICDTLTLCGVYEEDKPFIQ